MWENRHRKDWRMGKYTRQLDEQTYYITPEDDDYKEKLIESANLFRCFDEALEAFMIKQGYNKTCEDTEAKINFLKERFQEEDIPVPRNIRNWFTKHNRIDRKTAISICFAFHLNLNETQDFFRRICLERGLDCHDMKEAIYYYAICNQLNYQEAQRLIAQLPKVNAGNLKQNISILYTNFIEEEIARFQNSNELLQYLQNHAAQFGYNNARAVKYIQGILDEIMKSGGLAQQEYERRGMHKNMDSYSALGQNASLNVKMKHNNSLWKIYLQILGLDDDFIEELKTDRSLKPVIKDNQLIHPLAAEKFPDRDGIQKIVNGTHVSYERVRKVLILLTFYKFWIKEQLEQENEYYVAKEEDAGRCFAQMEKYLLDAGYPPLYYGNPYDWIFMWAMRDTDPLYAFRYYMRELYAVYEEGKISSTESALNTDFALE